MNCTSCGRKLDGRKKKQYTYASYHLQSKGFMGNMLKKDYWVFCGSSCKLKADQDWLAGRFETLHGRKKLGFKP